MPFLGLHAFPGTGSDREVCPLYVQVFAALLSLSAFLVLAASAAISPLPAVGLFLPMSAEALLAWSLEPCFLLLA
ncbi:hypothetical protein MPNT_70098 [Candidatus Methylacidithermus pantelleriae]|uniref:Uncharacterized protein n=1 Tax=Candidatus Methylacidithermus pantelleriae TaxID=2744239 RepID=A0A8J2BPN2_9BACT|nr:hypothetical protein MPNT_70098 [Candidatus Methylacidithermus pantelleriae]